METERLLIDAIRPSDKVDYYHSISHDKRVLETFVCRYAESLETFDFTPYLSRNDLWAIRLRETERLIGILSSFEETADTVEIGYGLGSDWWGAGYASEAVRRFIRYCFEEKGLKTVTASYFPGNDASRRVMEKCGMRFWRTSEKEMNYLGVDRDLIYYGIRREEFFALFP